MKSDSDEILQDIHRDFSYFSTAPLNQEAVLEVIKKPSPQDRLPSLRASFYSPRNTVYRDGHISYIDYFGRALAICQSKEKRFRIYCDDRDLAHEITYLTILSQVGQHLDRIALHRVHALGVVGRGRGFLILLPMGGGKTTLALNLLSTGEIKLLSEDSPLISRSGKLYPFPLRIGVRVGSEPSDIPSSYLRTVNRMEFDPKTLIDIEYLREKIATPCAPGGILLGERWLAGPPSIEPVARHRAYEAFFKNTVVGLGLYQGIEFLLERSGWEILGKAGVAFSRFLNSVQVIRGSQIYRFAISPNITKNAEVLSRFIREFSSR